MSRLKFRASGCFPSVTSLKSAACWSTGHSQCRGIPVAWSLPHDLAPFGLHFAGTYKSSDDVKFKISYACDLETALTAVGAEWVRCENRTRAIRARWERAHP